MTRMTVNGQAIRYRLDPATPLLWALRDASNLTGTKEGCGTGDCGTCTVLIDGSAVMSCQVTIGALEGADVTTIEGLSADRGHPLQQAWIAEQASLCGVCDPGFIMAAAALLRRNPRPSPAEIEAIPNLCRCGATPRIRRAIERAALSAAGAPALAPTPAAPPSFSPLSSGGAEDTPDSG